MFPIPVLLETSWLTSATRPVENVRAHLWICIVTNGLQYRAAAASVGRPRGVQACSTAHPVRILRRQSTHVIRQSTGSSSVGLELNAASRLGWFSPGSVHELFKAVLGEIARIGEIGTGT